MSWILFQQAAWSLSLERFQTAVLPFNFWLPLIKLVAFCHCLADYSRLEAPPDTLEHLVAVNNDSNQQQLEHGFKISWIPWRIHLLSLKRESCLQNYHFSSFHRHVMNAIRHYRTLCTVRLFILWIKFILCFSLLSSNYPTIFHCSPLSIIISHFCSNFEPLSPMENAVGEGAAMAPRIVQGFRVADAQLFDDCNGFIGVRKCCLLLAFKHAAGTGRLHLLYLSHWKSEMIAALASELASRLSISRHSLRTTFRKALCKCEILSANFGGFKSSLFKYPFR